MAVPILNDMFSAYHAALQSLESRIDDKFQKAVDIIHHHKGTFIVCGMGKSGLVGRKIAATMTSTGTPSVFLHPAEAMHGDLGIVRKDDVMLVISNSGETEEIVRLLPALRRQSTQIIAFVGTTESTLGKAAQICFDCSVDKEACPLNLAPTTSSLTTLVMGDALAIALMTKRNFKPADFAATHPGGKLGRQLLCEVRDYMRVDNLPFVEADMPMSEVIIVMTQGRLGMAIIGTADDLQGIITDGDLRRMLVKTHDLTVIKACEVMNPTPQTALPTMPLAKAEELMADQRIQCLLIVSPDGNVEGVLQIF